MSKQKAKIKNWEIHSYLGNYVLTGQIVDHPKLKQFKDDMQVTSKLRNINFENMTAETLNTIYELVK